MLRFIFYLFLGYLAYRLTSAIFRPGTGIRSKKRSQKTEAEEMIACAKCGTYVSRSRAMTRNGQIFCSSKCSS